MSQLSRQLRVFPKLLLQSSSQGLQTGAEGGPGNGHSSLQTKARHRVSFSGSGLSHRAL